MLRFPIPRIVALILLSAVFLWQAYRLWFRADRPNAIKALLGSIFFGTLAIIALFFAIRSIDSGLWDSGNCPDVPIYERAC
jgi:drug/metabolite transporter (DMT)-like permease